MPVRKIIWASHTPSRHERPRKMADVARVLWEEASAGQASLSGPPRNDRWGGGRDSSNCIHRLVSKKPTNACASPWMIPIFLSSCSRCFLLPRIAPEGSGLADHFCSFGQLCRHLVLCVELRVLRHMRKLGGQIDHVCHISFYTIIDAPNKPPHGKAWSTSKALHTRIWQADRDCHAWNFMNWSSLRISYCGKLPWLVSCLMTSVLPVIASL